MYRIKASVLHGNIRMRIDIKRYAYIGMAEYGADNLWVYILLQHPCSIGVPEIVKAHRRHITERKKPPKAVVKYTRGKLYQIRPYRAAGEDFTVFRRNQELTLGVISLTGR